MLLTLLKTEDDVALWRVEELGCVDGQWWAANGVILGPLLIEQGRDPYQNSRFPLLPEMVVVDCGTNIGTFSKRALQCGAKKVIGFDPSPITRKAYELNMQEYRRTAGPDVGDLVVFPNACWDETGVPLTVFINEVDAGWNSVCINTAATSTAETVSIKLDDALADEAQIDVIKMDIEGAEVKALLGAAEIIRKFKPRLILTIEHRPDDLSLITGAVMSIRDDYSISRDGSILFFS